MNETQKLTEAIRIYRETNTNVEAEVAINTFVALYNMLGTEELRDGIKTAMEDEGHDEAYEDIMYHLEGDNR